MTDRVFDALMYDQFRAAQKAACEERVTINDMVSTIEDEIQRLSASERAMMVVGWRPQGPMPSEMRKLAIWEALRTRLIEIKGAEKEVVKVLTNAKNRKVA
jgi:hypothetical protein